MTATVMEDAWMETCLVAISAQAGTDVQFNSLVETINPDIGEKGIEGIPLVNGGRITKFNPEGDTTITFEGYALQAGTDTGTTGKGFFDLLHTQDVAVPIRVTNDHKRTKYRVLILWTNDSTATTAQSATAANASAFRIGCADGQFTSVKEEFVGGILKVTAVFKCAPFDKSAVGNVMKESAAGTSGTDILPAIAAYTSSNKFG